MLLGATGCTELDARRNIQKGDKLYLEGKFSQAVALYDKALSEAPHLSIGQHNAGLAYMKLFEADGRQTVAYADKAAEHFQNYLEKNDDSRIRELMTTLWIDSDQYDKALSYWEGLLAKEPENRDVIVKLAGINAKAGRYDKAIEWHLNRVDIEKEAAGKAQAYISIADMQRSRLTKRETVDLERLEIADVGIAALAKAEALEPDSPLIQSLMGSIYQLRALAQSSSWARQVDTASQRYHQLRWQELSKKAAEKAKAEAAKAPAEGAEAEK